MATTLKAKYGTPTSIACTTTSLASDANILAGRSSAAVDNTTDLAVTAILGGTIATTGTPTINTQVEIWLYGSWDNGSTYSASIGGTDSNVTFATEGIKVAMVPVHVIQLTDTTARTYSIGPIDVAAAFGGNMPDHWGFWIVHNSGTTLGATTMKYTPVQYQNV